MSTELTKKKGSLKSILSGEAIQKQFALALPKHLSAERFTRIAITALTRTPKLQDCTQESFFKCLLDLSAMGLEPDGRRAHLIPYGKEATLIIDYKGLVELVRRSGDVNKIHADVVCEHDVFRHNMGEVLEHSFSLKEDRGAVVAAYAQVWMTSGEIKAEVMPKKEVDAIRNKSRAGKSGPWVDHYNEMAKKTAFRRLTKWLTLSPEIQDHIAKADAAEFQGFRNVTPKPEIPEGNPFIRAHNEAVDDAESRQSEAFVMESPDADDPSLPKANGDEEGGES